MGKVSKFGAVAVKDEPVVLELELLDKGIIDEVESEEAIVMTAGRVVAFASGTPPSCSLHVRA